MKTGIDTVIDPVIDMKKLVQYMIKVMFQIRKDGFKDYLPIANELDLVEEDNQIIHVISLDDQLDGQNILNFFKQDKDYLSNEQKYKDFIHAILNSDSKEDGDGKGDEDDDDDEYSDENSDEEDSANKSGEGVIIDNTETN